MNESATWKRPITAGDIEHISVLAIGLGLIGVGLSRRSWVGAAVAAAGVGCVLRGAQGYKRLYELVGKELPEDPTHLSLRAIKVEQEIDINRSAEELYSFWRNLENLPQVMSHLVRVEEHGGNHSHWVAKAPGGTIVEWEAEVINDLPNELIAWRSLEGADVDNAGSVHFNRISDNWTRMKVVIRYTPPGDVLGAKIAKLLGVDPAKTVAEDMRKFKEQMEVGSVL